MKMTSDSNWGCTIRVGQMLISAALMRHLIGEDYSLESIVTRNCACDSYMKILQM